MSRRVSDGEVTRENLLAYALLRLAEVEEVLAAANHPVAQQFTRQAWESSRAAFIGEKTRGT